MPIPLLTPDVTPPSHQVAILSLSKRFLSTPLLQRAIALVHSGQILFASSATNSTTQQRAILPDLYASRTVRDRAGRSVWRFDARRARETGGWLGTNRLRVPKWREVIELVKCVPLARDHTPSRLPCLFEPNPADIDRRLHSFALIIGSFILCQSHA
jgi:hypothetical protein